MFISAVLIIIAGFLPVITDAALPTFIATLIPKGKAGQKRNTTLDGKATIVIVNSTYAVGTFTVEHIDEMFAAGLYSQSGDVFVWAFNSSSRNGTRVPVSGKFNQSWSFNPSENNVTKLLNTGMAHFGLFNTKDPNLGGYRGVFRASAGFSTRGGSAGAPAASWPLGKFVNLLTDDLNDQALGARNKQSMFPDLNKNPDCIEAYPNPDGMSTYETFDTKEAFRKVFATSFSLGVSGWGAAVNASASYKKVSDGISTSKGVRMHSYNIYTQYSISTMCYTEGQTPLNSRFQSAWNDLPLTCETKSNCDKYYKLSKNFGTHIILDITTGASVQFFATVKNTSTVSTSDIKAALNAEYADTVEGKADVKNSNRNEKVSSEALYKIIVMGGIPGGNSKLLSNYEKKPKPEDINDFLKEGEKSSTPAKRTFVGIWEFMTMDRFSEDDKIITATAADETKAEVFKKLALETDYFIQGTYPYKDYSKIIISKKPSILAMKKCIPLDYGYTDGRKLWWPAGDYNEYKSHLGEVYRSCVTQLDDFERGRVKGTTTSLYANCQDFSSLKKEPRKRSFLNMEECCQKCDNSWWYEMMAGFVSKAEIFGTDYIVNNVNGRLVCADPIKPTPKGC